MSKRLLVLISLTGLVGMACFGRVALAQPTVNLKIDPPEGELVPFEASAKVQPSPVRLMLQARNPAGQPLQDAKIRLQIFTPASNFWLPTDFPLLEGKKLLEIEAISPDGTLQVQQMLPIRGTYQLQVAVAPTTGNQFKPFQQTLTLVVPENGVKYRNFGLLAAVLLLVGLGGGLILGSPQQIQLGEVAPKRVRLLLSGAVLTAIAALLIVNIRAELAESHSYHAETHGGPVPTITTPASSQKLGLKFLGQTQATVGKPANLAVQVVNLKTGQPLRNVNLRVRVMPLGEDWLAFSYQGSAEANGLRWQQQFFDGVPHRLAVEARPQAGAAFKFEPVTGFQDIDVQGVTPPLGSRLLVLAYLTGIVGLGLLIGLGLRGRFAQTQA